MFLWQCSPCFFYKVPQRPHQDYPYVHTPRPSFLAASWVALEDVHPDAGPLFYYPRSHRLIEPYDFGFGNTLTFSDGYHVRDFEEYLERRCNELALTKKYWM
jgi:ectoine hydroxylase-related dioxygenase (phytanoyl-CoA dioxygenase family)